MNQDGTAIVRRARFFLSELRAGKFPNATSIQRFDGCSKSKLFQLQDLSADTTVQEKNITFPTDAKFFIGLEQGSLRWRRRMA